jgi:RNA polymerase sigma-70 factor, ECF subfamily
LQADRQHREPLVADTYREIEAEIPRLRRYARALTRDVAVADDLVQDCLTRALGKLHLWQKGTDLRAWLFTILHNQYVNYVRRCVREGAAVGLTDNEPLLTRAPQQGRQLELRDLERAIAQLPEEQRSAILLVGLEGMRYEEVAAVLGVPVGTIRSRLSRGREALRKLVGNEPDERDVAIADAAQASSVGVGRAFGRSSHNQPRLHPPGASVGQSGSLGQPVLAKRRHSRQQRLAEATATGNEPRCIGLTAQAVPGAAAFRSPV